MIAPIITACRVCGDRNLKKFFDLGEQPPANSLLAQPAESEIFYPLSLSWCQNCRLVQLNETVDPKELFSQYVWVTGTSKIAQDFAQIFYQELIKRVDRTSKPSDNKLVIEIASNDGTFLTPFIKNNFKVLGVDPAQNIAELANKNNIPTKCSFFGSKEAKNLIQEYGPAKIVFARNVIMHVANTRDFVEGLAEILTEDGILAVETHYAKTILDELHYDYIYHEHLCYFTLKTLEHLLNDFGLYVFDLVPSPISGGGIIVYIKKRSIGEQPIIEQYRQKELQQQINDFEQWQNFARRSFEHKERLLKLIDDFKGKTVVGYGASARSSTLLNFCGIDSKILPVIADKSPLKQGKFTAGTHIPIESPEMVMARKPEGVVLLAWNFAQEIMTYLKKDFGYKGSYLQPLPNSPRIID